MQDAVESLLFPPLSKAQATTNCLLTIRQTPFNLGVEKSRWFLKDLLSQFMNWMKVTTIPGLWQVLKSLKITHKKTRQHVHSPDEHYMEKVDLVQKGVSMYIPSKKVVLFQDECTIYSKSSESFDYELVGHEPEFELGYNYEKQLRIIATLDAYTGQVVHFLRNKITLATLIEFYKHLTTVYPGQEIYIIQDNWPVHWHPDIRAVLKPQDIQLAPFEGKLPPSWAKVVAKQKYIGMNLNIQTIHLPTYASWLNPIEKLWRWLKQDVIHKHPFTDNFNELKSQTQSFLNQFLKGSKELIQYTGLLAKDGKDNFYTPPLKPVFEQYGSPLIWDV